MFPCLDQQGVVENILLHGLEKLFPGVHLALADLLSLALGWETWLSWMGLDWETWLAWSWWSQELSPSSDGVGIPSS